MTAPFVYFSAKEKERVWHGEGVLQVQAPLFAYKTTYQLRVLLRLQSEEAPPRPPVPGLPLTLSPLRFCCVGPARSLEAAAFSGNGVQGVRQAQAQLPQGPVVAGGGPEAPRLHSPPRPRLLERAPRESR
jgi:hypothetical protein